MGSYIPILPDGILTYLENKTETELQMPDLLQLEHYHLTNAFALPF